MALPWGAVLGGGLLVLLALLALRRPLLGLLGTRHAFRRPQHLVMVAIGLMVGTAVITGANVAGDSFQASALDGVDRRLGATDVVVHVPEATDASAFRDILAEESVAPRVDASALVHVAMASLEATETGLGESRVNLYGIDPVEYRRLGGLGVVAGDVPATVAHWAPSDVVVNAGLAEMLALAVGDPVEVYVLGPSGSASPIQGTIRAIVSDHASDPLQHGPAAFVERGVLAVEGQDRANLLLLSAAPSVSSTELAEALRLVAARHLTVPHDQSPVSDIRHDAVASAEGEGWLRFMFLGLGSFSVLAGLFLIVSLMAMLVDERKSELATMRATGAVRADVTQLQLHEGFVYATAGTVLGLAVGIGLAVLLVSGARTFSFYQGETLRLALRPLTLASAAGYGLFMTLVVMGLTAGRASGFHIAQGLRGEEATTKGGRRFALLLALVACLAGLASTGFGLLDDDAFALVLGPALLTVGLTTLLDRWLPRAVGGAVWVGLIVYVTASFFFIEIGSELEALTFPLRALLLILAGAVALVRSGLPPRIAALAARPFRRVDQVADPAFAYVRRRPARTIMTVTMVGLVVLVLVLLGTMFGLFSQGVIDDTWSGFDVIGTSGRALDEAPQAGVGALAGAREALALPMIQNGLHAVLSHERGYWANTPGLIGVTPAAAERLDSEVLFVGAAYPDARSALQAVAADPGLVIVSDYLWIENHTRYGEEELRPGDTMTWQLRDGRVEVEVIAVFGTNNLGGTFVHPSLLERIERPLSTRLYARSDAETDPGDLARAIESGYRDVGMEAFATREPIEAQQRDARTQLFLMQAFVGMGLLVGTASTGIVTARNVFERRREIGVMRAIGFDSAAVVRVFVLEAMYVVTVATLLGIAGGVLTAYGIFTVELEEWGIEFALDWTNIALVALIVYVTSFVAAWIPARNVSRIPPAQATRYSE